MAKDNLNGPDSKDEYYDDGPVTNDDYYDDAPIDRYDYVEDIYSTTDGGKDTKSATKTKTKKEKKKKNEEQGGNPYSLNPNKKRKMKGWVKALIIVGIVVFGLVVIAFTLFAMLFSRMNFEKVDTEQYIETVAEVADYPLMESPDVKNVLVIGADKNTDGSDGRSDSMMLVSINSKTKEVKIVSFLRDLYVQLPGDNGKDRLNAAFSKGGPAMLMATIQNNFRVKVDKYIETNFYGFKKIIDALGGIDITMTEAEANFLNEWKQVGAVPGENHLNGEDALYFARMRKLDSDFGRTERQRQVISAIFSKLSHSNPFTMYGAAFQLMPYVTTNMSRFELAFFAMDFMGADLSKTRSVPEAGMYSDYTTPEGAMVLVPNYGECINMLKQYLYE